MILEYSLIFLSILLGTEGLPRYKDKYEQIITNSHSYWKRPSKRYYEHKTAITQPSMYFDGSETKRVGFYENVEVPERFVMRKVSKLTPPSARSTREDKFYFWDTRLTFVQWSFRTTTQLPQTMSKYLYDDPTKILTRVVIPITVYPFIRRLQEGLDSAKTYLLQDDPIESYEQQTTITSLPEIRPTQSSIVESLLQTKDVHRLQEPEENKDTTDLNDIENSAPIARPDSANPKDDHRVTIDTNNDKASSSTTEDYEGYGNHSVSPNIHENTTTLAKDLLEIDDHSNATDINESITTVVRDLPKSDVQKGDYSDVTNTKEKIATTVNKRPELDDQKVDDRFTLTTDVKPHTHADLLEPDDQVVYSIGTDKKEYITSTVNKLPESDYPEDDHSIKTDTTKHDKTSDERELTQSQQRPKHDHSVTVDMKEITSVAENDVPAPDNQKDVYSDATDISDSTTTTVVKDLSKSHELEGEYSVQTDTTKETTSTIVNELPVSYNPKDDHSVTTATQYDKASVVSELTNSNDTKVDHGVTTATKDDKTSVVSELTEPRDQKEDHNIITATKDDNTSVVSTLDDHGVTTTTKDDKMSVIVNELTKPRDPKDDHSITSYIKDDKTSVVSELTEQDGTKDDHNVMTEDITTIDINELLEPDNQQYYHSDTTYINNSTTTVVKDLSKQDDQMDDKTPLANNQSEPDNHSVTTTTNAKENTEKVAHDLPEEGETKDYYSVTDDIKNREATGITTLTVESGSSPQFVIAAIITTTIIATTTITTVSITTVDEHDKATAIDMQTTTQMTPDQTLGSTECVTPVTATTPATKSHAFRYIVPYLLLVLASILIGVALGFLFCNIFKTQKTKRNEWRQVGTLKDIYVYPVKSCAPMALSEAKCTAQGLKHGWLRDRFLMIVNDKNNFISAKHYPELLSVYPCLRDSTLVLKHRSMEFLQVDLSKVVLQKNPKSTYVWGVSVPVLDCGREASEWLSRLLVKHNGTYRLVYCVTKNNSKIHNITTKINKFATNNTAALSYQTAYSIINQASVSALNMHPDCPTVSPRSFRPNFVVTGPEAKDEDNWALVKIGRNVFEVAKYSRRYTEARPSGVMPLKDFVPNYCDSNHKLKELQFSEVDSVPCVGLQMALTGSPGNNVARNDPVSVVYRTGDNNPQQKISDHDNDLTCNICKRPVTKVIRNGKYVYTCRNTRDSNGTGECSQTSLCHHRYTTVWNM